MTTAAQLATIPRVSLINFSNCKSITFTILGKGGEGPVITTDVIFHAQFLTFDNKWSSQFAVLAGILPDGTLPGDLKLGQTMFHSLGLKCKQNGEVQLLSMPGIPILTLNTGVYSKPLQIFSVSETQYKWHKSTTEKGLCHGKQYSELFPEIFNKLLHRNDFLSKKNLIKLILETIHQLKFPLEDIALANNKQ